MRRHALSIRRSFTLLGVGLAAIALLFALALGGAVERLLVLSEGHERLMTSVRAAEEIELNLLFSTRAHQLFGQTGEERWRLEQENSEAELERWLARARGASETEEERALVDQLTREVHTIRTEVLAKPPDMRTIRRAELDQALESSEKLIAYNERIGERAVEEAWRWSQIALFVSAAIVLLAVLGLMGVIVFARRVIYRPVQRLRLSLESRGVDDERHVQDEGPVEIREIASSVNSLIDRVAAQRAQSLVFISAVAHDLRTPMNSLRTAAQLAARQTNPEKQAERTKLILRQVDRMNRLVEDLLSVARIEAGQFDLHPEKRDLREVVCETAALYDGFSEQHEIRSAFPEEALVVTHDPTRLSQVVGNLLSNAIKYSPEGGRVDVVLRTEEQRAVIEVTDHGLGIPPEESDSIFQPFRRSGGARGEIPGVGLGLASARRLVRAHGGDIEVESHPGSGSTFRVWLPLGEAAAQRGVSSGSSAK